MTHTFGILHYHQIPDFIFFSKPKMLSSSNMIRTSILRPARLATPNTALVARLAAATIQTSRRSFSSTQKTPCTGCVSSGCQACACHSSKSRGSTSNIATNFNTRKGAAYATTTSSIPTEQWAQVLEKTGGGKPLLPRSLNKAYQLFQLFSIKRSQFLHQHQTKS